VTILDEDIPEDQYQRARRIGIDAGRLGMKDREILSLLHTLNRPTFFSLDHGFFKRGLCHPRYGLAYLDVEEARAAEYIRRTLRHQELDARNKRMGTVVRVQPNGIRGWRLNTKDMLRLSWG
jgi:hypothetical protein